MAPGLQVCFIPTAIQRTSRTLAARLRPPANSRRIRRRDLAHRPRRPAGARVIHLPAPPCYIRALRYYPIFLDLKDRPVLVVGAGKVGLRKTRGLLDAGAQVTV